MSVFVAVKVKDAELGLARFLRQVDGLAGNIARVVIIYGQSHDQSFAIINHWRGQTKREVEVYAEPYLPEEERHGYSLARLKQDIQALLKRGGEDFYLNLDCDLVKLPSDLIPRLLADQKDMVAPMVWTEGHEPPVFYDTYEFRKDNCMFHPFHPPGLGMAEPFPVDVVSTCYLAKREVELAGEYSNPYPHIPFCASLRRKGFQVWVDPRVGVEHLDLERLGIRHYPINCAYSQVPYITTSGLKVSGESVNAERTLIDRREYDAWLRTNRPLEHEDVKAFLDKRTLITASVKVFNESEYLPYFLKGGVYPWVDRLDIVEGACKQHMHDSNPDGTSTDDTARIIREFPDLNGKIRLVRGKWKSKEEIQAKLLEMCSSKWMLFIDADEFLFPEDWQRVRAFAEANQDGQVLSAGPQRFYNFLHDWKHVAHSLNPLSPWNRDNAPHPFLVWRDTFGLNFSMFHTLPMDGLGNVINNPRWHTDVLTGAWCQTVPNVTVYHFGNAKKLESMKNKIRFERVRDRNPSPVDKDWYFTGEMPVDYMIENFEGSYPPELDGHPMKGVEKIRVTQTKPAYKFEAIP